MAKISPEEAKRRRRAGYQRAKDKRHQMEIATAAAAAWSEHFPELFPVGLYAFDLDAQKKWAPADVEFREHQTHRPRFVAEVKDKSPGAAFKNSPGRLTRDQYRIEPIDVRKVRDVWGKANARGHDDPGLHRAPPIYLVRFGDGIWHVHLLMALGHEIRAMGRQDRGDAADVHPAYRMDSCLLQPLTVAPGWPLVVTRPPGYPQPALGRLPKVRGLVLPVSDIVPGMGVRP